MIILNVSEKVKKVFVFVAFFLILGSIFLLSQWPVNSRATENYQASISGSGQLLYNTGTVTKEAEPEVVADVVSESEDILKINAVSAISVEFGVSVEDKVLLQKDASKKLPIASLAKLMTALVVMKKYDLNQNTTISDLAIQEVGEQGNLKEGEVITIENLVYIMLIESSNRAARALSEVVGEDTFVALMNQEAQNLGFYNTHFEDSAGLDKNSYSTVEDLVKLTKHLFFDYSLFLKITSLKEYDLYMLDGSLHHKLINTNELLGHDGVIGGKTGYTHEAGGCFMVIQKKSQDKYAIHIVLGAKDRLLEMSRLMNFVSWDLEY